MTKNSPKPYKCHHMQCIFYPKMTKTAKPRIFPDKTLSFDDSKQLSPVSDQDLEKSDVQFSKKMSEILIFERKWPNFGRNKTQYDWFPGKSQNSKKFHTKN